MYDIFARIFDCSTLLTEKVTTESKTFKPNDITESDELLNNKYNTNETVFDSRPI